jgi:hypothetical protein
MTGEEGAAPRSATDGLQTEMALEEELAEADGSATDAAENEPEEVGNRARLAAALASAEEAADAVNEAAQRLPAIVDRIDALVTRAECLPIESSCARLSRLPPPPTPRLSRRPGAPVTFGSLARSRPLLECAEGGLVSIANA